MKKTFLLIVLSLAGALTAARAQSYDADRDDMYRDIRRMANKGFTNIGLSGQTLSVVTPVVGRLELELNSVADWGVSVSRSRTFAVHRNPLARMIYLGIDATWVDINYAQYGDDIDVLGINVSKLTGGTKLHHLDVSLLGFGPSVHVFPVGKLGLHAYVKYLPTVSTIFTAEDDFQGSIGYASIFTLGTAVSWGVISAGFEGRFGGGRYNRNIGDYAPVKGNLSTAGARLYVSLRY